MRWLDVTLPLGPDTVGYPGDPPFTARPHARVKPDDPGSYAVHQLTLGTHAGTHVDAPNHVTAGAPGVDAVPLEVLCGPAVVVDVVGVTAIEVPLLQARLPVAVPRVLLKTRGPGPVPAAFDPGYPHLTVAAAHWLREQGVALVGLDAPSVEAWGAEGLPVHHELLSREPPVVVVEGLDLREVPPGPCELVVLPLKLTGLDGAPARALVGVPG